MNYSEVIGALEAHANAYTGFEFITVGQQQVNTYATGQATPSQHLIILDPPRYTGQGLGNTMTMAKRYDIVLAFMLHIEQDFSFDEAQARVNVADQYATHFLHALNQNTQNVANFDVQEITNVQVMPWHRFSWNAQHMAGVSLEFSIETLDTFDYCTLEDLEAALGEFSSEFSTEFN